MMNKILAILAVVLFAVTAIIVIHNRRDYPMSLNKLDGLSQKWLKAESAITDMSGTLEVDISNIDQYGDEDQYTTEMRNTRYIKFQISGGNHVKFDILNQNKNLLRSFETPYSFDFVLERNATLLAEDNLPELEAITIAIDMDESGAFWPLTLVLLNHLQPTKQSSVLTNVLVNQRIPNRMRELSAREMENGDIEIYYQSSKTLDEEEAFIYRPDADDRVVGYDYRYLPYIEISGQWSGDVQTYGEAKIFTHYSGNFYGIIIDSELIKDE